MEYYFKLVFMFLSAVTLLYVFHFVNSTSHQRKTVEYIDNPEKLLYKGIEVINIKMIIIIFLL